ncbi:MAG: alpha/beta fold hydrolase [Thermocrispum sp.]
MHLTSRVAAVAGLITACLVATGLVACTAGEPERAAPPKAPRPVGDGPRSLQQFYQQRLAWGSCAGYASSDLGKQAMQLPKLQCARLKVPLDYADPDGPSVQIGVLRKLAQGPGERIGSLVINPGGPGASGTEAAAALTLSPTMAKLGARFDVVGFDPRGIGSSRPQVQCYTDRERDADRADDGEVDGTKAGIAAAEKAEKAFARKCAERTEHGEKFLANLGTRDVVRDMDVLRSVLGDRKLTYLGYSYGTRIGYTYAESFPDKVRALLLDGALDPGQDVVESLVAQGKGFGKAFGEFARWCVQRSDCALGKDPKRAVRAYQDLVRPLIERKVDAADGRRLSFEDASTATVHALYSQSLWEQLNAGLTELGRNRGEQLLALADQYMERNADGSYGTIQDVLVAVRCVDDPPVTDRAKITSAQRRFAKAAPFLDPGTTTGGFRDACAFWPAEPTGEPHLPDVDGVPAALVVSTTGDPATPYRAGVQLAKAMKGRLLTFEGTQHTVFGQGVKCVDDAGVAYLLDRKLPAEGTRCKAG